MKWIFLTLFLSFKLFAQSNINELPADVQKEIKSTEASIASSTKAAEATTESVKSAELKPVEVAPEAAVVELKGNKVSTTAKENEIPLALEATKKIGSSETTYFRMIMIVALLGVLACGTWIFFRRAKTQNIKRNKNEIKILAQHYLGPKKSLAVVRVAGESILVGITDAQINMIKTLSLLDDEFPEVSGKNFQSELDTQMISEKQETVSTYSRRAQINTKVNTAAEDEVEEFSVRGLKDLVSTKLKNMRSI